jgi:hypothetical protein
MIRPVDHQTVTFANALGRHLAPVLLRVRATGFFEAPVYMTVMTALSIPLFIWLKNRLEGNGTLTATRPRALWLVAYYALCFFGTNVFAVGFKTLIVEEMDYESRVWFEPYVGPLHFYIFSVVVAYVALLVSARRTAIDALLGLYVQTGLIGGYAAAVYRIANEPFSIVDPTTGLGGVVLGACFAVYNFDLYRRFIARSYLEAAQPT